MCAAGDPHQLQGQPGEAEGCQRGPRITFFLLGLAFGKGSRGPEAALQVLAVT